MNVENHIVEWDIPKPLSAEIYYDIRSAIEWNNRRRCNDIKLDNKLGIHSWYQRVNMIVSGVYVVGVSSFYSGLTTQDSFEKTLNDITCVNILPLFIPNINL